MRKILDITESNCDKYESNQLTVIAFDASWTNQGELVKNALNYLATTGELEKNVTLAQADVEQCGDLPKRFEILSVPTIACVLNGNLLEKIDTLEPEDLLRKIKLIYLKNSSALTKQPDSNRTENADDDKKKYLEHLINRAPVMVFMKGSPESPRCGFSRQLVDILAKHEIKYSTFDILEDMEVRQGLKEYSDWPTYPQIYAKGQFIGGLDILKQLVETNELKATLSVE